MERDGNGEITVHIETGQPFSPIQKYLNKPESKNLCVEFVLYTTYILLHIATIQKVIIARFIARYFEILFDRWSFTYYESMMLDIILIEYNLNRM